MKLGSFDPLLGKIDRSNNIFGLGLPLGAGLTPPGADFSTKMKMAVLSLEMAWEKFFVIY